MATKKAEQPSARPNKYRDGRWSVPSKRAKGYAADRKARVHTYGPKEGKELLLELKIGDEILKKLVPLESSSRYKIFEKIRIGFDVEGILGIN